MRIDKDKRQKIEAGFISLPTKLPAMFPIILSVIFLCTGGYALAQSGKGAELHIRHTADFEVTGHGKDPAWNSAEWVTLSRIKGSSSYRTRAKLLYSDKGIYALYHCEDKKITATIQEDFASLWREDVIEIFFWPDETFPIYLEYELSPLNYELAILVPNMDGQTSGWMPWRYTGQKKTRKATHVLRDESGNPTAWIGEFFVPYALLRPLRNVPPQTGTRWRANFYRIDYDEPESSYWSWQPVNDNFHEYMKYGTFVFD